MASLKSRKNLIRRPKSSMVLRELDYRATKLEKARATPKNENITIDRTTINNYFVWPRVKPEIK